MGGLVHRLLTTGREGEMDPTMSKNHHLRTCEAPPEAKTRIESPLIFVYRIRIMEASTGL